MKQYLFQNPLHLYLSEKQIAIQRDIQTISFDNMADINEIATDLYNSYYIEPIQILNDNISRVIKRDEVPVWDYLRDRFIKRICDIHVIKIPFVGDSSLLMYHNTKYNVLMIEALIENNSIILEIVDEHSNLGFIKHEYESQKKIIEENTEDVSFAVKQYNNNLQSTIIEGLKTRISQIAKTNQQAEEMGLPPLENTRKMVMIPITIQPKLDVRIDSTVKENEKEYYLPIDTYNELIQSIYYCIGTMERTPCSFHDRSEEQLRDHILSVINGILCIRGSGETFNNMGKTDILYTYQQHNLFIGECKIWKGPKYVMDGLTQLEGYLSWNDTKAALIIFYIDMLHMTDAIAEINKQISSRDNFVKMISDKERGHRYLMKHPADESKQYTLEVCFFNINCF